MRNTRHKLDLLFNPASIGLVGASNASGKMGNLFAGRLRENFRGRLFAVNPRESEIFDIPCFPTLEDVPGTVDLVLALLPGPALLKIVENCEPGKVKFLVAIPSGFGEAPGGHPMQVRLQASAAERNVTLLGPNTVGLMNCERGLNASMIPTPPPGGKGVSCLTQSGGFGMALSMYALDHGVPIAKFCDVGNMAGISAEDLLAYYGEDPATEVVLLFLEAVRNPDAFAEVIELVAKRKPVVMSVVGSTAAGRRASQAHLGLSSNAEQALERIPSAVVRANTGQDALDATKALLWQKRAQGCRLALVTGTGGIGAEIADLAVSRGLSLPVLSSGLQERLRAYLPPFAAVGNPIDVTPIWWEYSTVYPALIKALDEAEEVDVILLSITDVPTTSLELADALCSMRTRIAKPVCVFWGSRERHLGPMQRLEAAGFPCYRSTTATVNAAAALALAGSRPISELVSAPPDG